jgi:hypothetical protein
MIIWNFKHPMDYIFSKRRIILIASGLKSQPLKTLSQSKAMWRYANNIILCHFAQL